MKALLLFYFIFALSAAGASLSFAPQMDVPRQLTARDTVEVLWSDYLFGRLDPALFYAFTEDIEYDSLPVADQLRLTQMRNTFAGNAKSFLSFASLSEELALRIALEEELFGNINFSFGPEAMERLQEARTKAKLAADFRAKTPEEITQLVYEGPDLSEYNEGEYSGGVKLFLFCRKDRAYPCRMILKDANDRLLRKQDGGVWSLSALAKSAGDLPYHSTNGHTPAGAHSIDSVMPIADNQRAYGKYRRLILNWIPNDDLTKTLLPAMAQERHWWKQASIARNNGRKWLRIHGTGRVNTDPHSSYFPHRPTEGCVSMREGRYGEADYKDQRVLLDAMMEAMQLGPVYSNEVLIKGMLYVVEVDETAARVDESTLREFGIF